MVKVGTKKKSKHPKSKRKNLVHSFVVCALRFFLLHLPVTNWCCQMTSQTTANKNLGRGTSNLGRSFFPCRSAWRTPPEQPTMERSCLSASLPTLR